MIKCIASDMDGTLLNENHVVSEETKLAVHQAQENGIEFIIATGRSYREAKYVLAEADIDCPIICVNGAEIRSSAGESLYTNPIDGNTAQKITSILDEHDVYFELYTEEGTFSKDYDRALTVIMDIFMSANKETDYEKTLKAAKERFEKGMVHLVDSFDPLLSNKEKGILKFICFSFDLQKLEQLRPLLATIEGIAVSSSGKENIEINSIEAQKGIALAKFVEQKGISLEETMAIGDNYNDVSMFKCVGRSVAMGNAPQDIKDKCKIVTETNVNHGVAKAILEVLKEK